jgi:hypothetical protein
MMMKAVLRLVLRIVVKADVEIIPSLDRAGNTQLSVASSAGS